MPRRLWLWLALLAAGGGMLAASIDPRSLSYQAVYADWSIPALALK